MSAEKTINRDLGRLKTMLKQYSDIKINLDDAYTDFNKLIEDLYPLAMVSIERKISKVTEKICALMTLCKTYLELKIQLSDNSKNILQKIEVAKTEDNPEQRNTGWIQKFDKGSKETVELLDRKGSDVLIACATIEKYLEIAGLQINEVTKINEIKSIINRLTPDIIATLEKEKTFFIKHFIDDNIKNTMSNALAWIRKIKQRENEVKLMYGEMLYNKICEQETVFEHFIRIKEFIDPTNNQYIYTQEEFQALEKSFREIDVVLWNQWPDVFYTVYQTIKALFVVIIQSCDNDYIQQFNSFYLKWLQIFELYCKTIRLPVDTQRQNWIFCIFTLISGQQYYLALSEEIKNKVAQQITEQCEKHPTELNSYIEVYLSALNFFDHYDSYSVSIKIEKISKLYEKFLALEKIKDHEDLIYIIQDSLPAFLDLCVKKTGAFSFGVFPSNYHLHSLINLLRLAEVVNKVIEANNTQMLIDFFDENSGMAYGKSYLSIPVLLSFCATQNLSKKKLEVIVAKISDRVKKDWNFLLNNVAKKNTGQIYIETSHLLSVINQEKDLNQIRNVFGNHFAELLAVHAHEIQVLNALNEFVQSDFTINDNYEVKFKDVFDGSYKGLNQKPDSQHHACVYFLSLVMKGPTACQSQWSDIISILKKNLLTGENKIFKDIIEFVDLYLAVLDYCLYEKEYKPTENIQKIKIIFEKIELLKPKKTDINFKYLINHGITGLLNYSQSKTDVSSSLSTSSTSTISTSTEEDPLAKLESIFQYKAKLAKAEMREHLKSRIELRMTHAIIYFRMCQLKPEVVEYDQSYQKAFQEVYDYILENASEAEASDPVFWMTAIKKIVPPDGCSRILMLDRMPEEGKIDKDTIYLINNNAGITVNYWLKNGQLVSRQFEKGLPTDSIKGYFIDKNEIKAGNQDFDKVTSLVSYIPPDAGAFQYSDLIFILGKHHETNKKYEVALKFYEYYKYNILDKKIPSRADKLVYQITRQIWYQQVQLCQSQLTNPAVVPGTLFNPVGQTSVPSTPVAQKLDSKPNQSNDSRIPPPGGF